MFMQHVENKTAPFIFLKKFCKLSHTYPTNFLGYNFLVPTLKLKKGIVFLLEAVTLEQHFDSSRKNQRKSSKIQDCYKGKTFNDKWNKLFFNRKESVSFQNKLLKFNDFSLKIKRLDGKALMVLFDGLI